MAAAKKVRAVAMKVLDPAPSAVAATLPALAPASSGFTKDAMDFTLGSDGKSQRPSWAQRAETPWAMAGSGFAGSIASGSFLNRERGQAQRVARDFATSNPTIATLLLNLTTQAIGTGLTLSAKLDAAALGISPKDARELGSKFEAGWRRWSSNPTECDLSGRFNIHQLAAAGFEYWLITGELAALIDWKAVRGATSRTKISLLDPNQVDNTKSMSGPGATNATMNGVVFNQAGMLLGYYITPMKTGNVNQAQMPVFVAAYTPFGRQKVVHLFENRVPGQVRGLSPLVAALTPSHEKNTLGEYTQAANLIQTMYAMTITSELPSAAAARGLQTDDGLGPQAAPTGVNPFDNMAAKADYYSGMPIAARPGAVSFLSTGDKLEMHSAKSPNDTFDSFDRSLSRVAAKAAGASYEDTTGDYSKMSFSASRMAAYLPNLITKRRRKIIVEGFYQSAYAAYLEEAINRGEIELPKGCKPFWAARDAFTEARWLGVGAVQPDPLKAAQTTELELKLGLITLSDALAERGLDIDTVIAERKAEKEMLREAGLSIDLGELTPSNDDDEEDEKDEDDDAIPALPQRKQRRR